MTATRKHIRDEGHLRLAVLIDADNAQASVIEGLLGEVAKYGVASVKRIYGDFTATNSNSWKKVLLKHSINPVQQFAYTTGKNATDSSLIIDAMDLMHTGRFDGMCLVSSDSDFTRLAQRLREEGLTVYGFGEQKTPDPFVQACDKFIYTEILRPEAPPVVVAPPPPEKPVVDKPVAPEKPKAQAEAPAPSSKETGPNALPMDLLHQAIDMASDEEGWAHMGQMGAYLNKIRPGFDARLYGEKKLSDLLRKYPKEFSIVERGTTATGGKVLYIKSLDG